MILFVEHFQFLGISLNVEMFGLGSGVLTGRVLVVADSSETRCCEPMMRTAFPGFIVPRQSHALERELVKFSMNIADSLPNIHKSIC